MSVVPTMYQGWTRVEHYGPCFDHNTLHAIAVAMNTAAYLTKPLPLPDLFRKKPETDVAEEISGDEEMNLALRWDLGTTFFIRKYHVSI